MFQDSIIAKLLESQKEGGHVRRSESGSDESAKEHQDRFRALPPNGSVNCIGSRPSCAAFILRLATPGDSNVCPADRQHAGIAHPSLCAYRDQSPLGEALTYIAKYWEGLKLFLTDGRIEIYNNRVERTIRPENALFAGHDAGTENGATSALQAKPCRAARRFYRHAHCHHQRPQAKPD